MATSIPMQSGKARSQKRQPMSEINVTPFVDVMLVLLVIFMLTAPMLTVGVPVDLPKTAAKSISEKEEPITLTLNKEGKLFLQETEIEMDSLIDKIKAIMAAKPGTRIFVRGDKGIAYGEVMSLMGLLNSNGYHKVALLAELPKHKRQG